MDETYVRVSGRWMYLFRAVDNRGQTVDFYLSETRDREAAKRFLQAALKNPDNCPPHVFSVDGSRSYPAAIRELKAEGEYGPVAGTVVASMGTTASNPIIAMSNVGCVSCRDRGRRQRRGR